jgi:hypothetical protein
VIDQPDGVGVQRVDLQLLLDLGSALLGRDDAVADGRQGAVPKALPCILLQRAEDVLGVLFRLLFIEQRHDLPHHDVHGIVAHLLRDGDEPDAVLREPADVELQLEVIAEEPREAVDDDDIERRGPARARLNQALEFGSTVVRSRCAGLDVGLDQLIAACGAVRFALTLLIGNRNIVPACRAVETRRYKAARNGTVIAIVPSDHPRGPHSSSKRSPNHASNTSSSAPVIGTGSGQSSVTVHADRSYFGDRPMRGRGSIGM